MIADPLFQSVTFIDTGTIYYLAALVFDRAAPRAVGTFPACRSAHEIATSVNVAFILKEAPHLLVPTVRTAPDAVREQLHRWFKLDPAAALIGEVPNLCSKSRLFEILS